MSYYGFDVQKGAFGEQIVSEVTPAIQASAVYGLDSRAITFTSGTTGADAGANSDSLYFCETGTDSFGFATVTASKVVAYRSGQGLVGEFTALFDTPAIGNVQRVALQNGTDAIGFEYSAAGNFGIAYSHHGSQEIQELLFTVSASVSENATVTIDGVGYTVPLTNTTVEGNARETADSLNAEPTLALWRFQAIGGKVVGRSFLAIPFPGAFLFSSATATAAWTQIAAGTIPTNDHIPQTSWNGINPDNWENPFNPQNGNVFKVQMQYLGFGNIFFYIENPTTGEFDLVHTLEYTNENQIPSVSNPTFGIGWNSINVGNTSNVELKGASMMVAVEGEKVFTSQGQSTSVIKENITSDETALISIASREVFGSKVNLGTILPKMLTIQTDSNQGALVKVIKNATLGGQPVFQYVNEQTSIAVVDSEATTATGGQVISVITVGQNFPGQLDLAENNIEISPLDTLTVTVDKVGGSTHNVSAAITWQEDI